MNGLNRFLILDVCATAIALLALTGTVAAISVSPIAQAPSDASSSGNSSRCAVSVAKSSFRIP